MDDSAVEERLRELERRSDSLGQPLTVQRRAVLRVLVGRADHPTAEDVYEAVASELPGVSKATVYRALDHIVRLGLARKVAHPGSVARYDGNVDRHHHLLCTDCGSIADLSWDALDAIPVPDVPRGFRVRDFSVNFLGTCRRCATRSD